MLRRCSALPIVGLVLVACGSSGGIGSSDSGSAVVADFESLDPSDVLRVLGADPLQDAVHFAMGRVRTDCMAERGFLPPPPTLQGAAGSLRGGIGRNVAFGISKTSVVEEIGLVKSDAAYLAELGEVASSSEAQTAAVASKGEAYSEAWSGAYFGSQSPSEFPTPSGTALLAKDGCVAESYLAVFGDIGNGIQTEFLPSTLVGLVEQRVLSGEKGRLALDLWRECAAAQGFQYESPSQAFRTIESSLDPVSETYVGPSRLRSTEKEFVELLRDCDRSSDLFEIGWSLLPAARDEILREKSALVEIYKAAVKVSIAILEK